MTSFIALHIALSARLGLSGGNRLAEIKPIPNQAYKGRTRATPIQSAHIYVTVLRDHRPRRAPRPLFPSASSFRSKLWLMDSCSAYRCQKAADRLRSQWPSVVLVHTPLHASWLNQIEIYFSIVQRKVLIPNDFSSLAEVEERLLAFQHHYEQIAVPFHWTFTRRDLAALLARLSNHALAHVA